MAPGRQNAGFNWRLPQPCCADPPSATIRSTDRKLRRQQRDIGNPQLMLDTPTADSHRSFESLLRLSIIYRGSVAWSRGPCAVPHDVVPLESSLPRRRATRVYIGAPSPQPRGRALVRRTSNGRSPTRRANPPATRHRRRPSSGAASLVGPRWCGAGPSTTCPAARRHHLGTGPRKPHPLPQPPDAPRARRVHGTRSWQRGLRRWREG